MTAPVATESPESRSRPTTKARSPLRSVMLPAEHGGWGLTLEPGLLGLLIAPSAAGVCLALAAPVAFLLRTPAKIALGDLRRGRSLPRTRLAARVAAMESLVLIALALGALGLAAQPFWLPALIAIPFVAVEGSYDIRSRGRRLVPELAGAVGVCSVAAMILLADGKSGALAAGVWLILAARAVTSIPHVRSLIARIHHRTSSPTIPAVADVVAILGAVGAVVLDDALLAGAAAVVAVVVIQRVSTRGPLPKATILGMRQLAMGLAVIAITAVGVIVST